MRRGGSITFEHEWEPPASDAQPEPESITLEVDAYVSDYYPAVRFMRNGDPGYPEEGGEVEQLVVRLPDGSRMESVPSDLQEELEQRASEEHFGG